MDKLGRLSPIRASVSGTLVAQPCISGGIIGDLHAHHVASSNSRTPDDYRAYSSLVKWYASREKRFLDLDLKFLEDTRQRDLTKLMVGGIVC